ncbi:cyclic nucleotide-binding domain-containing protein [Candidatus Peregrinibacteria bacterium]|nr:cyclic nucleotide-binding domain-containing protein [Candidatus Peregrinibacteria bacterium]
MEKFSILPILKKIPILKNLNEEDESAIIKNITLQYFPAGYEVFIQGKEGDSMYIIKRGSVNITRDHEKVATLHENDFFGEMALFSNEPRNASAVTETEGELFALNKEDFCALLLKDQHMADHISAEFVKRLKQNNEKNH